MRASLYLSGWNLPHIGTSWEIIRGLAPLSPIGDVLRKPLRRDTSGLGRKLIASAMSLKGEKLDEAAGRSKKARYKLWGTATGIP